MATTRTPRTRASAAAPQKAPTKRAASVAKKVAPAKKASTAAATRKPAAKAAAKTTAKAAPARAAKTTRAASAKKSSTTAAKIPAAVAKKQAIAKAKRTAPNVSAQIGSTPHTKFRGNPDIFGRLVEDHDRHRALLAMITATKGDSKDRKKLFKELVKELKSHAAAEEQALWSTVMRNPKTTDDARHAVGEHKEIDKMLDDLAARDMSSSGWLRRFAGLHEEYLHHIKEEEQEQFVAAEKHLTPADIRYMKQVFNRRKAEEKASAKVVKKLRRK